MNEIISVSNQANKYARRLWLENIPSSSIHSEEMISQMKDNTEVRLIGINENYNSYEEIKHFYDLLDTKKGVTFEGETVDKAQVTGNIYIDEISYSNYVELSARYPEVKINAKRIICTVIFKNENTIFDIDIDCINNDADKIILSNVLDFFLYML